MYWSMLTCLAIGCQRIAPSSLYLHLHLEGSKFWSSFIRSRCLSRLCLNLNHAMMLLQSIFCSSFLIVCIRFSVVLGVVFLMFARVDSLIYWKVQCICLYGLSFFRFCKLKLYPLFFERYSSTLLQQIPDSICCVVPDRNSLSSNKMKGYSWFFFWLAQGEKQKLSISNHLLFCRLCFIR